MLAIGLSVQIPWVPETFLARFPDPREKLRRSWLRPTTEDLSAFGQPRKFPPRAREKNLWYPG